MEGLLFNRIEKFQNRIAFIDENEKKIRYKDIISISNNISKIIDSGSLTLLITRNKYSCFAIYIGLIRCNSVILFQDEFYTSLGIKKLIKEYIPDFIVCSIEEKNKFTQYEFIFNEDDYCILKSKKKFFHNIHKDLSLLLPTSGSTSSPKMVRLSNSNLLSNTKSIIKSLNINRNDRTITTMPLSYSYGLSIINTHLYRGSSIVINQYSVLERNFWKLLDKYKVNNFGGVPYFYEMLDKIKFHKMHLPSLRYITQAGGKMNLNLSKKLVKICEEKKIIMYFMYGQTEATARISYLPWDKAKSKVSSIGIPIPKGKMWLIDNKGKKIKQKLKKGDLIYKGKNVCLGYSNNYKDLSKGDLNKGILVTGDVAKQDEDDFFYIIGRKKRFLKIFGYRINLDEIEKYISKKGIECACTGEDNNLRIFIKKTNKNTNINKILLSIFSKNIKDYKIYFVNEIPRNHAGKINYSKLK